MIKKLIFSIILLALNLISCSILGRGLKGIISRNLFLSKTPKSFNFPPRFFSSRENIRRAPKISSLTFTQINELKLASIEREIESNKESYYELLMQKKGCAFDGLPPSIQISFKNGLSQIEKRIRHLEREKEILLEEMSN